MEEDYYSKAIPNLEEVAHFSDLTKNKVLLKFDPLQNDMKLTEIIKSNPKFGNGTKSLVGLAKMDCRLLTSPNN